MREAFSWSKNVYFMLSKLISLKFRVIFHSEIKQFDLSFFAFSLRLEDQNMEKRMGGIDCGKCVCVCVRGGCGLVRWNRGHTGSVFWGIFHSLSLAIGYASVYGCTSIPSSL